MRGRAHPKQYPNNVNERKNTMKTAMAYILYAVTIQTKQTTNTKEINKCNYVHTYRRESLNKPRPCRVIT